MFHGWTFDPEGDQAAADSTRSSTSLDTGSSVNPRTARRLLTASYTSMIAHPSAVNWVFSPIFESTRAGADETQARVGLSYSKRPSTSSHSKQAREADELLGGQHRVDALLLHQDHDELCWLRRARVAPDRVYIVRALVECLSWRQGDLLPAPDPFDDRPFQHIDKGVCIVPMDVLHSSRRILDGQHQHLPSGHVSEILLHDGDHNWLRRRLREGGTKGQGSY